MPSSSHIIIEHPRCCACTFQSGARIRSLLQSSRFRVANGRGIDHEGVPTDSIRLVPIQPREASRNEAGFETIPGVMKFRYRSLIVQASAELV